jgi:hypothetical protein
MGSLNVKYKKWDNIIWAPKQIKSGVQKVLFERLNKFLVRLSKLFGAKLSNQI